VYKLFANNKIWIISIFVFAIIAFFFLFSNIVSQIRTVAVRGLSFTLDVCSDVGEHFESKKTLTEENLTLRKKAADLSLELEQFKELKKENERLRSLLRFQKKIGFSTVSAEIIARNPNNWEESFLIDKGFDDDVHKGSAVCSAKGLLGMVTETTHETASVMLITHPSFKAGGMLRGTRVHGILMGAGKDTLKMLYLPVDAEVKRGSVVITSGFSRIFPKGINVGRVVSVGKSKTGLYKYAIIKPYADPFKQEEVLCIR